MTQLASFMMKSHKNLYNEVISLGNLTLAWRKARKGKTQRDYVIYFEEDLIKNLLDLYKELKEETYSPKPLKTFILRDPKTRKISKSAFRDRIVHHALCNIIEPFCLIVLDIGLMQHNYIEIQNHLQISSFSL